MKYFRRSLTEYTIVLAAVLAAGLFYHFDTIRSGFDLLPGDGNDALLNILAADSWGDVFRGETAFRQNRIFYPFPTARGFTDLSLTLYLLELPWRMLGFDMFSAAQTVYLLLHGFGILSMFYLLRKVLNLNFTAALGGALLSFYCNASWLKLHHTQFFFTALLPLLAICVIRYCQLWQSGHTLRRILYGMGAFLTFAWIAYSNYYTAFFAGLFGAIFFLVYGILSRKRTTLKQLFPPYRLAELTLLALWGILLFAPFFYTYMPQMNDDYERIWTAAQGTLPTLADIVNVGPQNLLWGKLYDLAFPPIHKYVYENYHGLPLLTLAVMFWAFLQFRRERRQIPTVYLALAGSLFVTYLISLKFAHCVSLWYFVWKYVPGGNAIRAGGRIYVFLMFPLMTFLWWMIDRSFRNLPARKQHLFCGIILLVLLLDNYNTIQIYGWKRSDAIQSTAKISPPPNDMKCFYIINSAGGTSHEYNWHIYGLPAWQIARYYKTFSINGYSGNKPVNFHALDPLAPGYRREIGTWITQHNLTGVWALDVATGKWQKHSSAAE